MYQINLNLPDGRVSKICIGEQLRNLTNYTHNKRTIIITDTTLHTLYGSQFPVDVPVICIEKGESNKTLISVQKVIEQLIELDADRNCLLVGIGGGIICDLTGFIASIFMRGVRFGFVSSTLLAQVDASVGGKNGANSGGYKNMIGVFNQPDFVLCATDMLKTLPEREVRAGLAEVIKTALIADAELFDYLVQNAAAIKQLNQLAINHIVKRSVEIKAAVVQADEREAGERRKLNFGHTFGHAIEKNELILHGEAVSIGMVIAAQISKQYLKFDSSKVQQIVRLLKGFDLPTNCATPASKLLSAITKDKKREAGSVHFVLLEDIGKACVRKITYTDLDQLYLEGNVD